MKGVFFEGKRNLVLKDDLPKPSIKPNEVLINVKYCGICGSDIESYDTGVLELPGIVIGHEFSGIITEVGQDVNSFKVGDKVTANPIRPCGKCYWCKHNQENLCKWASALGTTFNGAMAEYVNVKEKRVIKLPEEISLKEGALFEPLAGALYAVQNSGFKIGQICTVIGAGSIGLLVIQVLNAAGASNIYVIEPVETKQNLALKFGATDVYPPKKWSKINKLTNKIGPDYIFDCIGLPETIMTSINLAKRGGTIEIFGIHTEPFEMKGFMSVVLKSLIIKGVYGYPLDTFPKVLKLVQNNKIDLKSMISRIIPMNEVPAIFDELVNKKHDDIKVLVEI